MTLAQARKVLPASLLKIWSLINVDAIEDWSEDQVLDAARVLGLRTFRRGGGVWLRGRLARPEGGHHGEK